MNKTYNTKLLSEDIFIFFDRFAIYPYAEYTVLVPADMLEDIRQRLLDKVVAEHMMPKVAKGMSKEHYYISHLMQCFSSNLEFYEIEEEEEPVIAPKTQYDTYAILRLITARCAGTKNATVTVPKELLVELSTRIRASFKDEACPTLLIHGRDAPELIIGIDGQRYVSPLSDYEIKKEAKPEEMSPAEALHILVYGRPGAGSSKDQQVTTCLGSLEEIQKQIDEITSQIHNNIAEHGVPKLFCPVEFDTSGRIEPGYSYTIPASVDTTDKPWIPEYDWQDEFLKHLDDAERKIDSSEPKFPKVTKCECGAEKTGSSAHSSWCPKHA